MEQLLHNNRPSPTVTHGYSPTAAPLLLSLNVEPQWPDGRRRWCSADIRPSRSHELSGRGDTAVRVSSAEQMWCCARRKSTKHQAEGAAAAAGAQRKLGRYMQGACAVKPHPWSKCWAVRHAARDVAYYFAMARRRYGAVVTVEIAGHVRRSVPTIKRVSLFICYMCVLIIQCVHLVLGTTTLVSAQYVMYYCFWRNRFGNT